MLNPHINVLYNDFLRLIKIVNLLFDAGLPLWAYVIIAVAGLISLFVIVLLLIWKFVIKRKAFRMLV